MGGEGYSYDLSSPRTGEADSDGVSQAAAMTRSLAVRLSGHAAIQPCGDHLHCVEDGVSLKTVRHRQSLPPAAGLLSGPLVAAQASAQKSAAFA